MTMASNADFNKDTTGTEAAKALGASIRGKNVMITGVSPESIGASTVLAIACQGPGALILASRTAAKLDKVAADIEQKHPAVKTHKVLLDLSSLDSVKAAATHIDTLVDHIDVLINNAGISQPTRDPVQTPGLGDTVVDQTFFTNHLGPFLLTHLLLPKLRAAARLRRDDTKHSEGATRIINVSSHGHQLSPVRFNDYPIWHYVYDGVPESQKPPRGLPDAVLRLVDGYPGFIGYGQSKTANILVATELTRRFKKSGDDILALSLHPGTIDTGLSRSTDEEGRKFIETTSNGEWKTLDQGAATTIVAAFDPRLAELDVGGKSIGYLSDCQLGDHLVARHAADPENAKTIFQESERMLRIKMEL